MNSKEVLVKKKNKCAAKKKERLAKLCTLVRFFLFFCPESSLFLSFYSISTLVHALISALVPFLIPTPISNLKFSTVLLFYCVLIPAIFIALFLSFNVFISCYGIPTPLLLLLMLGSLLSLKFLPLKTFKQSLLDEP